MQIPKNNFLSYSNFGISLRKKNNMLPRFALSLLIIFFQLSATGQVVKSYSEEIDGAPHWIEGTGYFNTHARSVVYTGEKEAAIVMTNYYETEFEVIKMNSENKIIWRTPVEDYVVFLGKHHGNLILLTKPFKSSKSLAITATLIEPSTGKIESKKKIYESDENIDLKYNTDFNQNFKSLLVRQIKSKRKSLVSSEFNQSSKFELVYFDKSLQNITVKDLATQMVDRTFIGSCVNDKGDVFLVGDNETGIVAEKFDINGSKPVAKIELPFESGDKRTKEGILSCNPNAQEQLVLCYRSSVNKTGPQLTAKFDFSINKSFLHETLLYGKEKSGEVNSISIKFFEDKIITCREIHYGDISMGDKYIYKSGNIFISVYSPEMKLLNEFTVKRYVASFYKSEENAGYFLTGDKLNIVYHIQQFLAYETKLAVLDLRKMEIEKEGIKIERESGINKDAGVEAEASMLFGNTLLVPSINLKGLIKKKRSTFFQKIEL